MVQVTGRALRAPIGEARAAMETSAAFNLLLRQSAYLFMAQVGPSVLAGARGTVNQRLARWLLMARDRLNGDTMPLTHNLRRSCWACGAPGVTLAFGSFKRAGRIGQRRGRITVVDRAAPLDEAAASTG